MSNSSDDGESLLKLLDEAIGSLGEKDRKVVIDRYLKGLDVKAVATAVGTTPAGVQKRLERAVAKLRAHFQKRGGGAAITPAIVTALLLAAAPSPATAAPAGLAVLTMSNTMSPAALTTAKSVLASLTATKVKVSAIAAVMALIVGGVILETAKSWTTRATVTAKTVVNATKIQGNAQTVPFATLRSGVTVALVGVSSNPSYKKPWWHADGSPSATSPYSIAGGEITAVHPGNVAREFAFVCDRAIGVSALSVHVESAENEGEETNVPVDKFGRTIPSSIGDAVEVPDRPAVIRFNLTSAPWNTFLTTSTTGGEVTRVPGGTFSVGSLEAQGAAVVAAVTADYTKNWDGETRLAAIDMAGAEHAGECYHSGTQVREGRGKVWQLNYRFEGLKLQDVKAMRCQSREDEQWVEFRNVSLHAGQKTVVTLSTSDQH